MSKHRIGDCRDCMFWRSPRPEWTQGECRRHAPMTLDLGDGHTETKWPRTHSTDFCGDFAHVTLRKQPLHKFIAQLLTRVKP